MTPFLPALSSVSLVRHHVAVLAPMTFLRADSVIFRKGPPDPNFHPFFAVHMLI